MHSMVHCVPTEFVNRDRPADPQVEYSCFPWMSSRLMFLIWLGPVVVVYGCCNA